MNGKMNSLRLGGMVCSALAVFAVIGCNKVENNSAESRKSFKITVAHEEVSKASLTADGNVVFNLNDDISVWDKQHNNHFYCTEDGASAVFEGDADVLSNGDTYTVASPYGTSYTFGNKTFQYTIPQVQTAVKDGLDPAALICVADHVESLESGEIVLKNLVGLLKIEVPQGLNVREIQVGGGVGATIAIAGQAIYNYESLTFSLGTTTSTTISLVPEDGNEFIQPGVYHIACLPRQIAGIVIAYVDENNLLYKRKGASAITIQAGTINDFGALNNTNYTVASTGTAILRMAGDDVQFTGRLKKIAGGSGLATEENTNVEHIIFSAHSLFDGNFNKADNTVSSGAGNTNIFAYMKGNTMYVRTEASKIIFNKTSAKLFRDFKALKSVVFNDVDTQAETSFERLFSGCTSLKTIDFGNCDLSKVIDMQFMCQSLESLEVVRFGKTATTACANFKGMLMGCINIAELYLGPNFTVTHLSDKTMCNNMFYDTAKSYGQTIRKCELYMSQNEYEACRISPAGAYSIAALNSARFHHVALNPAN